MLIESLFVRAASERGPVTQAVAATLAPAIMRVFAGVPALGGSGKPLPVTLPDVEDLLEQLPAYTDKQLQAFSNKGFDQSLATHLINGLFVGLFLAERLPEHKAVDEERLRLWALGFAVHDYTKAYRRNVTAGQLPIIRRLVAALGGPLAFDDFLPGWRDYLDDIVFIAQNIQTFEGANLNLRDYQQRIHLRDLEPLRMLGSVADVLVHITSPSDVMYRDARGRDRSYNLRQKMQTLFGAEDAPRLVYHKLLEVRGLISNLLNNAIIDVLEEQGYEPFLFFPEGAVYLAPKQDVAQVNQEQITGVVWERIAHLLTGGRQIADEDDDEDRDEDGGLRVKRTKDYMKVPAVLYELLPLRTLIEAGQRAALSVRSSKALARFGAEQADDQGISLAGLSAKEKEALYLPLGKAWAESQGLPIDVRVDQLAEYLAFLWRRIFVHLFPKLPDVTAMLLDTLGLANEITPERAERQRSGTPTGWCYVAARYLQRHPALDPTGLAEVMQQLAVRALALLEAQDLTHQESSVTARIFQDYARRIVELDGILLGMADTNSLRQRFADELQRYVTSQAQNQVVCSLCASPYEAADQDVSVVLFKPQQYSNKAPLDRSRLVRGICPICALELMLRQVQQGLPASKTQERQAINLYLYPTYFFTAETAAVIKPFIGRLKNLNLFRLIFSHLEAKGFEPEHLLNYEDFLTDDPEVSMSNYWKPRYDEGDQAALFFLTLQPPGRKTTETDTWILPTFFALALPLLLGVKCVATSSFAPLYRSAGDFQDTVRLDGPHDFTRYILGRERFRIDELPGMIERLLRMYALHLDVFADPTNYHWGQLTTIAKDLVTDPLYVFHYFDRRQRGERSQPEGQAKRPAGGSAETARGISPRDQQRYLKVFEVMKGDPDMGFIGRLVDAYTLFYRAAKVDSAYAVLRPLGTALKVTVESDPRIEVDDLVLLVAGAVNDDQERVRADQAEGFDPIITNKELGDYPARLALSRQRVEEFAQLFVNACFQGYCDGDRALLRERVNRIRSAARFYYLSHYARRAAPSADATDAANERSV